ncbi:hypothetical protein [Methylobacterium durans]|uniref:Uncharacterized protein n=1 Tax=Methylobacterium durans TaxID=2202825 RepID=A0A2U8WC12_9HYPH|nr:hypothetical protein [Methylobacterium durans]AWN43695.1 hypothetical protein DK389_28265 [Methylobacterium durans]
MKILLAGAIAAASIAVSVATTVPASAQRIDIGPGGPSIDLRSRGERERDFRRAEARRDRDYDRRYYRTERFDDDRPRRYERRGYGY